MYTVEVKIRGTAPLLQHRYPMPTLAAMRKGGKATTGSTDWTEEWRDSLYVDADGGIYQPSDHIERAMVRAAVNFKIPGKRGKTYKDLFAAAVFVNPDQIPHGINVPDELTPNPKERLYLDVRPVVIQRARVSRIRPAFKAGWELEFEIDVLDEGITSELLQDVLELAGKQVGIGDFRPKFGRFNVARFEVSKSGD